MLEVYPNCINFMAQGKITVGIDQYSSINGKNIIIKHYDVSKNSFTGLEVYIEIKSMRLRGFNFSELKHNTTHVSPS